MCALAVALRSKWQTDAGQAELMQQMKSVRVCSVRSRKLLRGATAQERQMADARDVFDSFDLDGSGTIDVSRVAFRQTGTYRSNGGGGRSFG